MAMINGTNAPLYLKMDIEGHEYAVLQSIVDSGSLVPMQIAVEVHLPPALFFRDTPIQLALFINYLYHKGGYFVIDRHDNPLCQQCSEILLSRVTPLGIVGYRGDL